MNQEEHRLRIEFLNLRTLPARLTMEEVGYLLNCSKSDVRILTEMKKISTLGHPKRNSVKYYSYQVLRNKLCQDKWLHVATITLAEYHERMNSFKNDNDPHEIQEMSSSKGRILRVTYTQSRL